MSLEEFRAEFSLPFTNFYDRHTPHVPMPQLEDWFHSQFPAGAGFRLRTAARARVPRILPRAEAAHVSVEHGPLAIISPRNAASPASTPSSTSLTPMSGTSGKKSTKSSPKTSSQPDETLFIGDMQHDIETAQARRHPFLRRADRLQHAGAIARGAAGFDRRASRRIARRAGAERSAPQTGGETISRKPIRRWPPSAR